MDSTQHPVKNRTRKAKLIPKEAPRGGYYLRLVQDVEPEELKEALCIGLEDEIAMMRVVIRRVFEAAAHAEMDVASWSKTLGTLGTASTRLARLLQAQQNLSTNESGMSPALSQALAEVVEELGLR